MPEQSALLADDGAIFQAIIQVTDAHEFMASCNAILDNRSHILEEYPRAQIFARMEDARRWVHYQAAARGFKKVRWKDEFSFSG